MTAFAVAALFMSCGDGGKSDGSLSDAGVQDAADGYTDLCTETESCALESGVEQSDYLAPVGDSDRWTFSVTSAGTIAKIVVRNDVTFSPIRLQAVLFGPDGVTAVAGPENSAGNGLQRVAITVKLDQVGQYTLRVLEVGNDAQDRRNPYYVVVTLVSEPDTHEPNNTYTLATTLADGQPTSGFISYQRDEDWYKISAESHAILRIAMAPADRGVSPVRFRWELWSLEADRRIAESDEPTSGAWRVENRAVGVDAGDYFLRVLDLDTDGVDADETRAYQLTVTREAEPDAQDLASPNETPPAATTIQLGTTVDGYVAATGDLDYYKFRVSGASASSPKLVVVEATLPEASDVDLAFSVLDTDGETRICETRDRDLCYADRFVLNGSAGASSLRTAHVVTRSGDYFVVVRDFQDNDFDMDHPYHVTVTVPNDPDTYENYQGDSRSAAVDVPAVGTGTTGATIEFRWVEGYLSYANDIDWYRFDIPGPPNLAAGQNGDWLVEVEIEMGLDGPSGPPRSTPVELQAFFRGETFDYGGYGKSCRRPDPNDPDPCQYQDSQNSFRQEIGIAQDDCLVVFRERTGLGSHYFRLSDLNRDDFDIGAYGKYRLRVRAIAGCPAGGKCEGIYTDPSGNDLCGRP
ncbi:MAG: hypothetical protein IPK13_00920 [Deltaproteobacteria bacterium]|nr:hypothetical protein [Deltaproteobacteria bacterium]